MALYAQVHKALEAGDLKRKIGAEQNPLTNNKNRQA
jgi:hypothetical protein